ncbi:ras and EF-hand domain-containing protein-like [Oratosquilla oratoria]|uniref:ras and EF-hand domain-containing protein-like n=1 Tax=Oratosquilla oratoria TaxID=337810 RepID=UPI003F762550
MSTCSSHTGVSDGQLQQLFEACDRTGKGFIVATELQELCGTIGIGVEDSDVIFADLDHDGDGQIDFEDFAHGFREFLRPSTEMQAKKRFSVVDPNETAARGRSPMGEEEVRRRESVYQAWSNLTYNLVDSSLFSGKSLDVRELCSELRDCGSSPALVARIEGIMNTLLQELHTLHVQNQGLEEVYKKERELHSTALQSLEAEMEQQVERVEERVKIQVKQQSEEEKRQLQEQMDTEMAELQAHLKIFQKVDSWLQKDRNGDDERVQEVRRKMEEAIRINRELKMNLQESSTNMALLRTELAQMRLQYEEKSRELHVEREQVLDYIQQNDNMKRQLDLLYAANRQLQDTNDSMRDSIENEAGYSPTLISRSSSLRSSPPEFLERHRNKSRSRSPRVKLLPPEMESKTRDGGKVEDEVQYGIKHPMEDIGTLDSGLSTLRDPTEEEGPLSLEEELLQVSNNCLDQDINICTSNNSHCSNTETLAMGEEKSTRWLISQPAIACSSLSSFQKTPICRQLSPVSSQQQQPPPSTAQPVGCYEARGPPERTYKVVFAGDAAVGKSTFIVRLCQGIFASNIASTLGVDFQVKTLCVDEKNMALQLWDTAGQERFRSITKTYFRRADGVMLLFDVTSERSFLNVRQWIHNIDEACLIRVPIVICGNKTDQRNMATAAGHNTISSKDGEQLARTNGVSYIETSSKTGDNVVEAIIDLARQMAVTEDIEVQTSALKITGTDSKSRCCSGSKKV